MLFAIVIVVVVVVFVVTLAVAVVTALVVVMQESALQFWPSSAHSCGLKVRVM